jgi:hypothetical protein
MGAGGEGLPLSFSQQRLWFLDRFAPGSTVYSIPALCRIAGPLDVDTLRRALREVARRHEVLRTTFAEGPSGLPRQVIAPEPDLPLPLVDLGSLPIALRPAEEERLAMANARRPFDLETGPLARFLLVRAAQDDHALIFNLHHIAADGWSLGILARELSALYTAFAEGAPSPLPELPVQYADFAVWQRNWLAGPVLEEQLSWWRSHFAGAPAQLDLPTDRPRPAIVDQAGAHVSMDLPAELVATSQAMAFGERVTPFMVWLVAFATLLSRWAGQDDLVIGSPVAGAGDRGRADRTDPPDRSDAFRCQPARLCDLHLRSPGRKAARPP